MNHKNKEDQKNEVSKNSTHKFIKYFGILITVLLLIAITCFGALELTAQKYTNKTKPSQSLYGYSLSGLSKEDLLKNINLALESKFEDTFKLDYQDTSYLLKYSDLGIIEDAEIFATQVSIYKEKPNHAELLQDIFSKNNLVPHPQINSDSVISYVQAKIPSLKPAINAHFNLNEDGEATIVKEQAGVQINSSKLVGDIKHNLLTNKTSGIIIETEEKEPEVKVADIEDLKDKFSILISHDLTFTHSNISEKYSLSEHPEFIQFEFTKPEVKLSNNEEESNDTNQDDDVLEEEIEEFTPELMTIADATLLKQFAIDKLKPQIDEEPKTVEVSYDEETEEVSFSDEGMPALVVDLDELQVLTNAALEKSIYDKTAPKVKVPVREIDPVVEIDPVLQARGITEIITSTYTTYYGSTYGRMTNINVGSSKFSGVIIPQGEEFSFNTQLGRVDGTTGFVPELVIKSDGTYPEYGGGLCQVSSTLYRAALDSGLKITERSPHSYAVSYYAQVKGHGLDATIYPGVKDIKLLNDSPGDILIQTFTDGAKLYYRLYGTKTKTVAYDGPYISNYTSPGKAQEIKKPGLAPGYRKQVEVPHTGFNVVWYITTTDLETNESTTETVKTRYHAIPAKFLVGPAEEGAESDADSTEEATT